MINTYIEQIIKHPLFLKLKEVVENNPWHDHEDVYSHSVKTGNIAKKEIVGDFITDSDTKKIFQNFTQENIGSFKRTDIMVLIALLHDIGKLLNTKEGMEKSILVTNSQGITSCPGHEYWGSTIVGQVLEDLSLPEEVTEYIARVIKLHDTFSDSYFETKKDWPIDLLVNDVKSRAEGYYKEALFNMYCDIYTALPSELTRQMIVRVLNNPKLYNEREYVIS